MKTYTVYVIKERCSEQIVYVGMTFQTLHKRFNQHVLKRKISPKDYFIQPIESDLPQPVAVTLEEMLIVQYKTRDNGWNKGSFAFNGYSTPHTEERKAQWSKERKGKPFKGRQNRTTPNSLEHNAKIGKANSRPIICLNDGKTYDSLRTACKKLGLSESKVSLVCQGKRTHTKGFKFSYL